MDQSDTVHLSESCQDSDSCKINTLLDSYSLRSEDERTEQDGNIRNCNENDRRNIHATTIGTIVVRCGPIQLVIALLQSPNNIFIKVVEVEPKITVLGLNIEDSICKQNDHDNVLENLQNLPGPMEEFVFKVDKLLAKKRISSELVNAMAETLNIIWLDILNLMQEKHHILHLCTQFHIKMSQCFLCMDQLERVCLETILPLTVIDAQEHLNKFKQMRIDMLTAVMAALKDGNELLAQLRSIENTETLDTRPEHIKRDALRSLHQVQQWLESLHDRRNIQEASWLKRKSQLEKCLALALLSCELFELEEALGRQSNNVSDSFTLGECEHTANIALRNYQEWKLQALQFRDRALKITRAKEKLQDPSKSAEDVSCARAYAVLNLCTEHLDLVDKREHWLTQTREFFLKAKNCLLVLEKLEVELSNTLLPTSLTATPKSVHDVNNFSEESLQLGNAIVNEAGCTPQELQGVKRVLDEIENRKIYLKSICVASNQDQQRVHNALLDFFIQYEGLLNWVKSADKTHLQQYRFLGQNLEDAKEFLLKHHELMQDLEIRGDLINKLLQTIKVNLNLMSAQQRYEVDSKADLLHKYWIELKKNVLSRVDCVSLLILFFEKANEVHVKLDCLQKHLKQTPDGENFQVLEISWRNIQSDYSGLKGYGTKFGNIKIDDPYIVIKPSTQAMEDILNGFSKSIQYDVETSLDSWRSYIESKRDVETILETIMSQNEETANKTTKVDSQLYPVLSMLTIDEKELCDISRAKLENVNRDIETAQDEIQQRKHATLSIQGKDQESLKKIEEVIEKLEELKLKLDKIKYDYRLLLENILQFLENALQLKCIINKYVEETLHQQSSESSVQEMIIEHKKFYDVGMDKFRSLIIQSELLIERVRILEPDETCEIDIDRILKILENVRMHFESKITDRMLKLELLEMLERFKLDLRDFDHSLNRVHMQLAEINEQTVDNSASAKTSSLAFEYFERTVELLEKRIEKFAKTVSQQLLKKDPEKEAYFNKEIENLIERWQTIKEDVQQKRQNLNQTTEFFEVIEKIEIEYREISYFYKCVLQKVPNIRDSIEARNLVNDIEKYLTSREEPLRSKLDFAVKCSHNKIKVTDLYNDVMALFQLFAKLKCDINTDQDRIENEKNIRDVCENSTIEQKVIDKQIRNLTTHNLPVCEDDLQLEIEEQQTQDKTFQNAEECSIFESTFKPICGEMERKKEDLKEQAVVKDTSCFHTEFESKNTKEAFTNLKYTLPYFKSSLKDATVREGEKFIFKCEVAGDPEPEIKWFKDGFSIQDMADYKTSYQRGHCSLLIEETFAADSARFACRASNLVGSIDCTALLLVKENSNKLEMISPRIVQFLKSGQTTEGSKFQFTCAITGNPLPIVQWFKNDKCIDNSPDYVIQSQKLSGLKMEASLKFEQVSLEDDAVYTCRASNPVGIEHCSASLFVEPVQPTEKPYFKIPLSNAMVRIGQEIKLEALIWGIPHPDVYWLHNGKPYIPLDAKYEHGRVALTISHAYPKDAGEYVLFAKNIAGEVNTMCNVHVKGRLQNETSDSEIASDMDTVQPAVQMPLKDVSVFEGKSVRLDCIIIGQPEPEVIWYHSGQPIKESADVQLLFQGDRCSLIIQEVYQEDAGVYKVVAINSAGETSSSCNVTVDASKEMGQELKVQHKSSFSTKYLLPNFEKLLSDLLVHEGDDIELEVIANGDQPLTAKWFFANKELSENEHIILEAKGNTGLFKLIIRNFTAKDMGVYMVKVSNNVGDAKCFSNVTIKSINIPENQKKPQENPECPKFEEVYMDKNVSIGDHVKFECVVKGKPSPKVFWNFNDKSIHGDNYQISSRGDRNVLIIQEVNPATVGKVTCVAENEAGKAICEAFLNLTDVGSQAQSSINSMHTVTQEHNNATSCVTMKKKTLDTFLISQVNSYEENMPHSKERCFLSNTDSCKQELHKNTIGNTDDQKKANIVMEYSGNLNASSIDILPTCFHKDVAPRFITPLSGKIVDQGTDVILDAAYEGFPSPKICIEKDGKKLVENNKINILIQRKRVTIELKDVCVLNAGRYTVTASNILGHSTSTADLVVKKTVFPPVFGKRLLAQVVKMGEKITMDVEVTGLPEPTVIWLKDDIPIGNAGISKHSVLSLGNSFKLVIEKAQISDSGKYMVMATNFGGEAKSIADFAVIDSAPGHMHEDVKIIVDDVPNRFKTEHSFHTNQSQEKISTDLNGSSLSKIITEHRCTTEATMRLESKLSNLDIPKLSYNFKSLTDSVNNIKPSITIYSDMPDCLQESAPSKADLLNAEIIQTTIEANKTSLQTTPTQFPSGALDSCQPQVQHQNQHTQSFKGNQYSNNCIIDFKPLDLSPGSPPEICYMPSIDVTMQTLNENKCNEEVQHAKLSKGDLPILLPSDVSQNSETVYNALKHEIEQNTYLKAPNLDYVQSPPLRVSTEGIKSSKLWTPSLVSGYERCGTSDIESENQEKTDISFDKHSSNSKKCVTPLLIPQVTKCTTKLISSVTSSSIILPGSPHEICYANKMKEEIDVIKTVEEKNEKDKKFTELITNVSTSLHPLTPPIKYSFKFNNTTFNQSPPVLSNKACRNDNCESDYDSDRWKFSGSESDVDMCHYLKKAFDPNYKTSGYAADTEEPKQIQIQSTRINDSGIYTNSKQKNLSQYSTNNIDKKDYKLTTTSLENDSPQNISTSTVMNSQIKSSYAKSHFESATNEKRTNDVIGQKSPVVVVTPPPMKLEMTSFPKVSSNPFKSEPAQIEVNDDINKKGKEENQQILLNNELKPLSPKPIKYRKHLPFLQQKLSRPIIYYNAFTGTPLHTVNEAMETKNFTYTKNLKKDCQVVNFQETNPIKSFDSEQVKESTNQIMKSCFHEPRKNTTFIHQAYMLPLPTPTKFIPGEFRESDYESKVDNMKIHPLWSPCDDRKATKAYRRVTPPQFNRSCSVPRSYNRVLSPMEFDQGPEMFSKSHMEVVNSVRNRRFIDTDVVEDNNTQSYNSTPFKPSKSFQATFGLKPIYGVIHSQCDIHGKIDRNLITKMKYTDSDEKKVIGITCGLRSDFKRASSEGNDRLQIYSCDSAGADSQYEFCNSTSTQPINSYENRNENVPKIPYFSTPLKDIAVKVTNNARFECIVQSNPRPHVVWTQNGVVLECSNHVFIEYRNGICRLTLINVDQNDSGYYTCSATNSTGVSTTFGNLDVSSSSQRF